MEVAQSDVIIGNLVGTTKKELSVQIEKSAPNLSRPPVDDGDMPAIAHSQSAAEIASPVIKSGASLVSDKRTELHDVVKTPAEQVYAADGEAASNVKNVMSKKQIPDAKQVSPEITSDENIISRANIHLESEQLLEAARLLRTVKDKSLVDERHTKALLVATEFEHTIADLTSPPSKGWTKQGESHKGRDTVIYYKVDSSARLVARIETPIEPSLLVPLISVFNESQLYETWIPHWNHPRLGVKQSIKLKQRGRAGQVILVTGYMPWPLSDREVVIDATAIDDIDANGHICVKMQTRQAGEDDGLVPPPEEGAVRVDFDGGLLFRKCPQHHESLRKSKTQHNASNLILVSFTMFCDCHIQYVPQNMINFVTRSVLGRMWGMLLNVAEDIRNGKRPQHAVAIAAKRDLFYDWVDERITIMLNDINASNGAANEKVPVE